ncbi:hypothetical protein Tco_0839471 [Tanacetum coccineum]|uniref:Uncharacterized protein n=1 Tax=Tanacetum coccineum TaxID=301880 RepID=A0ABQ5AV76_9ASTR
MSRFILPKAIDKSVQAHLKNILQKYVPDFGKIKLQKAAKKSTPKYLTTLFDRLKDQSTPKKRRRDNQDQDPLADLKKEKKKRKQKDPESSKKHEDQADSSKKGKSPSKSSKADKFVHAEETIHDVEMEAGESVEDYVVDTEDPTQADASVHKQDKSKGFKMVVVERPDLLIQNGTRNQLLMM